MAGGWFYDSRDGNVAEETGIQGVIASGLLHVGGGYHGPFATLQDLINFYNQNAKADPGWVPPQLGGYLKSNPGLTGVTSAMEGNPGFAQSAKNQVQGSAGAVAGSVGSAVGSFLGDLTSRNLWLRVAKIIVGLGLILAGVIHLSGAGKDVAVAAGAAAKGAVLA